MNGKEPEEPKEAQLKSSAEFLHVFEEMSDLLQYALENAEGNIKVPLPKNLEEQMVKLEHDVEEFCRMNEAIMSVDKDSKDETILNMPKREKEVFDRSKKLVSKAEEKIAVIKEFLRTAATKGLDVESSPEKRKEQFKRFGLREKWKKM